MNKVVKNSTLVIVLALGACASEAPDLKTDTPKTNPYKVELSKALKNADELLANLSKTKTRAVRNVSEVKAITKPKTRAVERYIFSNLRYFTSYSINN